MTIRREIETGTLTIEVERNDTGLPLGEVFDVAARANPKRGFLIVSHLIGRHVPTRPATLRWVMRRIASRIDPKAPGPVIFLGMAETAVGLGQGVHAAWCDITGRQDAWFIQSTRQTHERMPVWCRFEEGHSHATSHLIHEPADVETISSARTLVMIDDECSTGTTFVKAEQAMRRVVPGLTRVIDAVITDWSDGARRERHSLVSGRMKWESNGRHTAIPGSSANEHGRTDPTANPARTGYPSPPRLLLARARKVGAGERVTVLADGENAYDALRVAEQIEAQGCIVAVQSITRSPVHVGGAMRSRAEFSDSHGSGATCYAYNLGMHRPDRYVIVVEREGNQRAELAAATGMPESDIEVVRMIR